jgi:hypothetical protein
MCDPRALVERDRNIGDGGVRHTEQHELALVDHGDPALAQASRDGRADAA